MHIMSKQVIKTAVPVLRFPEFEDMGGWWENALGNLGEFTGGGTPRRENDSYWNGSIPWISSSDISEDSIHHIKITRFITDEALKSSATKMVPENSILLVSRVGVGKLAISKQSLCTSQDFTNFTPDKDNLTFIAYYLKSVNRTLLEYSQGMAIKGFTKEDISKLRLFVPTPPEQQKIADCLSSLDDLIYAQSKKIDTLKVHKKGLMQRLFPAEGESVPELRFREFEDAGEWVETPLGELGELVGGLTYSPDDVRDEGLLVLRSSNIQKGEIVLEDRVYVTPEIKGANPSRPNDILICVRNGSKALIGKNALIPQGLPLSTHGAFMTTFRSSSAKFVHKLFQTESYDKQVSADLGATINSINNSHLIKYKFHIPMLAEQQKIADCLSSLDELITAQSQKLDALKIHKKGLMQQLFP